MESFDKMKIDFSGKMNTINILYYSLFSFEEWEGLLESEKRHNGRGVVLTTPSNPLFVPPD